MQVKYIEETGMPRQNVLQKKFIRLKAKNRQKIYLFKSKSGKFPCSILNLENSKKNCCSEKSSKTENC